MEHGLTRLKYRAIWIFAFIPITMGELFSLLLWASFQLSTRCHLLSCPQGHCTDSSPLSPLNHPCFLLFWIIPFSIKPYYSFKIIFEKKLSRNLIVSSCWHLISFFSSISKSLQWAVYTPTFPPPIFSWIYSNQLFIPFTVSNLCSQFFFFPLTCQYNLTH